MSIILASASPRRQQLLQQITTDFTVQVADIDETQLDGELPKDYVIRLAKQKCMAVVENNKLDDNDVCIGCDTIVHLDDCILGKPKDKQQASQMMHQLSGKTHYVHTGVYIFNNKKSESIVKTTMVEFEQLSENDILQYINTNEPYDKAGGYGIQGWASKHIIGINGCYFNVMGFPVQAVNEMLRQIVKI